MPRSKKKSDRLSN